ncbi:CLUMA_CG004431, isoform A [Clunio marinus]|uniref:CLUMA_CG004431, isoform A n=1 Tax=Clunio marinus TaxID=568069 RepID=A0A1J1HRY5_9DIPT|nr:CLUMA_CG004431, isoform A [Clunio marinus]
MNHQCETTQSVCLHGAKILNEVAHAIAIEIQHIFLSYPIRYHLVICFVAGRILKAEFIVPVEYLNS